MVQWTPFIQTYKHRKYQWVQLAGHSGNFKAGKRQGTVMKKLCASEEECYKRLHGDALEAFVPEYQGTLEVEDEESKSKQSKQHGTGHFASVATLTLPSNAMKDCISNCLRDDNDGE